MPLAVLFLSNCDSSPRSWPGCYSLSSGEVERQGHPQDEDKKIDPKSCVGGRENHRFRETGWKWRSDDP